MYARLLIAVATTISLVATVAAWQTGAAAAAVPDQQYVGALTCRSAGFVVPGVSDVRSALAAHGVTGDADAVRIDLSIFDNEFAPGTFLNAGPFTSKAFAGVFSWDGLVDQKMHFYRLNAHVGARWVDIGHGSFETPDCFGQVDRIICSRSSGRNTVEFQFPLRMAVLRPGASVTPLTELQNWLDLSLLDNGFVPGTFLGARIGAAPSTYTWSGIAPGLRHVYRWNTLVSDGTWGFQDRGSFVSLRCDGLDTLSLPRAQ
jgi:hypothetical protein